MLLSHCRDRNLTLSQNYRRLGLVQRLNAQTGGTEKRRDGAPEEPANSLHINGSATASTTKGLGEAKVERDPETGKILRVVRDDDTIEFAGQKLRRANPLNDPLNDLSDQEDERVSQPQQKGSESIIVQQLEQQADKEGQKVQARKPRHQSKREDEWIARLVEKHGDDITAMARDRKLNAMQQTEGDLRRRIRKWKENRA